MSNTFNELLESGAHFGHKTSRWHPKMAPYIHSKRDGTHIIDLTKTVEALEEVLPFITKTVAEGKQILFVGTKRQSQEILATEALRSKQFFVNHRWLGGTLTNFQTVKASIHLLKKYEKATVDGTVSKLTKKEALNLS